MNEDQQRTTVGVVSMLAAAWSHQDFPEDAVRVYVAALRDIDSMELSDAVVRLVKKVRFRPTVAEIRREVAEHRLQLPSPSKAYEQVSAHASTSPDHPRRGDLHPAALAVMDTLGGSWAFRTAENPEVLRAQFMKAYDQRRDETISEAMVAPAATIPIRDRPMLVLPESTSITPRPLYARWLRRQGGIDVDGEWLTDDVCHDAIMFLNGTWPGWSDPSYHPLAEEALRVMDAYHESIDA